MKETVLFVQHGDYREAFRRFSKGGEETYLDQLKSVRFVESLSDRVRVVVAAPADEAYDEMLGPNLRAIGVARERFHKDATGAGLVSACSPSRVIPRTAHIGVLRSARESHIPCFPLLADIFERVSGTGYAKRNSLSAMVRLSRLRTLLTSQNVVGVGNHGLNAAKSLSRTLSVPVDRVTPWEWTPLRADPSPKAPGSGVVRVFFAGVISEDKGAGDLVRAASELEASLDARFEIVLAGSGPALPALRGYVRDRGLETCVRLLGQVPRAEVLALMRAAHVVVVPSRHSYPEGMPNVIFEALAARTPLVLSDHPSFAGRLAEGDGAVFFSAADQRELAEVLKRVVCDQQLYSRLSWNALQALQKLYVGTSWYRLIDLFLEDPTNKSSWVEQHSLAAYDAHREREIEEGATANAHTN